MVRKCTAQHLANLVDKVGPARLLSGGKDLTDRILPAVTKLAQDSSQEARYVKTFRLELSNQTKLTIPLIHPTGTLGAECCCHCHSTLTLTRSWRNISPPRTFRMSGTPSSLSRQRYRTCFTHRLAFCRILPCNMEIVGFFRVLVRCPKTRSQPGADAPSQAAVRSGPRLSTESHSTRPTGGCLYQAGLQRCRSWIYSRHTLTNCIIHASSKLTTITCVICRESNSHYSCRSQTQSVADKTEYIKQISGLLGSKDFKERIKGINQLVADCQHNPNVVISSIYPVSTHFPTISHVLYYGFQNPKMKRHPESLFFSAYRCSMPLKHGFRNRTARSTSMLWSLYRKSFTCWRITCPKWSTSWSQQLWTITLTLRTMPSTLLLLELLMHLFQILVLILTNRV